MGLVDALRRIERSRASAECGVQRAACDMQGASCGVQRAACFGMSTVIAGDLNTWSTRETALRHLLEHFPDSPPILADPTRGPFPTDHLLFRRADGSGFTVLSETYRRIEDVYYSDHNPIVAYVKFN